jgi:hypothetical protein
MVANLPKEGSIAGGDIMSQSLDFSKQNILARNPVAGNVDLQT